MQKCQLQTWLSEDNCPQFEAEWKEQLELYEELKDKPSKFASADELNIDLNTHIDS